MNTRAPSFLTGSFFILAANEDMRDSWDEFEFWQNCNRVTALD